MSNFWNLDFSAADLNDIAVVLSDGRTYTYRDLRESALEWRDRILEVSDGREDLVVLEFETSVEAIGAYLGALNADRALLVVEPGHAGPETPLRKVYAPEIVIARTQSSEPLSVQRLAPKDRPADRRSPKAHPDLALLLSTSGSTGDPKLVRLSGENIASNAASIAEYLQIKRSDRAMLNLPLFYSYGLSVLNSHLAAGAAVVLNDMSVVDDGFWPDFRASGATSLALVPHQFDLLARSHFLEQASELAPGLRYITQAGGRLDPELARTYHSAGQRHGWDLVIMYGQTEAAPRISWVPPEKMPEAADTIGQAIPGGTLWLADDAGEKISEPGTPGELVYTGPNVMMGYGTSRTDLALGKETHELRTGDIAELTEGGLFRIVGRLKRFVKLFGLRLSLDQIEALLARHSVQAEAVAVEDTLVLLHTAPDVGDTARDIVAQEYDIPTSVIHAAKIDEFPLLSSGKMDRPALERLAKAALSAERMATRHASDVDLAETLAQATRTRQVKRDDSFTSLGGDSLSYLQVQLALEERLGRAPDGWEHMTLAELEALAPASRSSIGWGQVNIDVLLRLMAICLVVAQHASDYPLYGGTWILILIMGYSAARFQLPTISAGKGLKLALKMLYPIVPLYYLILIGYQAGRGDVPLSKFFFVDNYSVWDGETAPLLVVYWFVSIYTQFVALLILTASIPALRQAVARSPYRVPFLAAVVLLGANLIVLLSGGPVVVGDLDGIMQWPVPHRGTHGLLEMLPLFLLGWMLFTRNKTWHLAACAIVALVVGGAMLWMDARLYVVLILLAATGLLATGIRFSVPRFVAKMLQQAAGLTLFVYLLHNPIVYAVRYSGLMDVPQWLGIIIALVVSFAVAFVAKLIFDLVERQLFKLGSFGRRVLVNG